MNLLLQKAFSQTAIRLLTFVWCWGSVSGCKSTNYYALPAFTDNEAVNAIIEIPAGTNKKLEYDRAKNSFVIDQYENQDRVIAFLPYPGNYGFIPSTLSDPAKGGDGDALDVLVISEAFETGSSIEVIPVALLKLIDDGEKDYKIIAVPRKMQDRVLEIVDFNGLKTKHPAVLKVLELWFLNYNTEDPASLEGWGDEKEALQEIKKHLKKI
ncbi:MAG: inorganic diphosphatase [Flavobacteriaceae bacterium]